MAAPADCSGMFKGYINVESISFNGAFHTENTTCMSAMFENCGVLTQMDVSGFDTANVTGMSYMFAGVSGSFRLVYSSKNFGTSNVESNEGFMDDSFNWKKMFESGDAVRLARLGALLSQMEGVRQNPAYHGEGPYCPTPGRCAGRWRNGSSPPGGAALRLTGTRRRQSLKPP